MTDAQITLEESDSITIKIEDWELFVFVCIEANGDASVSISNGEQDSLQVDFNERILSIKSPRGDASHLIN